MTTANQEGDNALPAGWNRFPLLDVCSLIRGVSYKAGEASTQPAPGRVPLLRATNIGAQLVFDNLQFVPSGRVSPGQMLRPGDVVVAMSSGSKKVVGKAGTLREPWHGTFGAFCAALRPSEAIDWRFFGYFFQTETYRQAMSAAAAGVNINNLKREHFQGLSLPLPPLAEQRRIVAKVEELLARVNAARERLARVPAILKHFRQSVLARAFSGEFANRGPVSLRERWQTVKFLNVVDYEGGAQPPKEHFVYEPTPGYVRLLQIRDFGEKPLPTYVPDSGRLKKATERDLLVARYGGGTGDDCLGRVCTGLAGAYNVALVKLVFDESTVSPGFLKAFLLGPWFRAAISTNSRSCQLGFNRGDLGDLLIPVPPLPEQIEIANRLESLFTLADTIEQRLAAGTAHADRLTQSILAKAFRGELVPTDAALARRQ